MEVEDYKIAPTKTVLIDSDNKDTLCVIMRHFNISEARALGVMMDIALMTLLKISAPNADTSEFDKLMQSEEMKAISKEMWFYWQVPILHTPLKLDEL